MQHPLILAEKDNQSTTILTLNRPKKRNALTIPFMGQLCDAIETVCADTTQRVLVIRGAGPAFCAGIDLREASDPEKLKCLAQMMARLLLTVSQASMITIAAVHGAAVAGGAGLMSACDLVVAADDTRIGYPESRRGLVTGLVMPFLLRQLRERDIQELLLTAELISAKRAMVIGLVNRVVPKNAVMKEVRKIVKSILQTGPEALLETKRILRELWPSSLRRDIERALEHHLTARHSTEAKEGIEAFLGNRAPRWISKL